MQVGAGVIRARCSRPEAFRQTIRSPVVPPGGREVDSAKKAQSHESERSLAVYDVRRASSIMSISSTGNRRPDYTSSESRVPKQRKQARDLAWTSTAYFAEGLPWSFLHQLVMEYLTATGASAAQVGYT